MEKSLPVANTDNNNNNTLSDAELNNCHPWAEVDLL